MIPNDEKKLDSALTSPIDGTEVPALEEDFSLEEILAEYGAAREQKLLREVEQSAAPEAPAASATEDGKEPAESAGSKIPPAEPPEQEIPSAEIPPGETPQTSQEGRESSGETTKGASDSEPAEFPKAPRPISLEEVVGSTVDAVMEEHHEPLIRHRRGLFSRRKLEETEELYAPPEPEEEPETEPIGPEMDVWDAGEEYRTEYHRRRAGLPAAAVAALLPTVLLVLEQQGIAIPVWSENPKVQTLVLLGCLAVVSLLCRSVFAKGVTMLRRKRCTSELLIALSSLLAAGDCGMRLLSAARSPVMPYAAVSCLALVFALWGNSRESRGRYDTFRSASMDDEPPYFITETGRGACKQRGEVRGFYTTAMQDDVATLWQTVLLPVVLVASLVFAGLSSLGQGRGADFLLNWSAILASGASFALPLCWGLPFSKLAAHLQKTGCAVAGWCGAEKISRKKSMILTDADLFPPGTIQLNGVKVFGEEMKKATSYAAAMARSAGSGLERLFDGLLRSEGGHYEKTDDFSFFEEGGWSATIHGETVLMGTASFMRKMEIRLPGNINLKTGMFLSVDRQLIAVFAVKYNPAENVDFALRMMRRSRIMPILASRDPNITPSLLKRKFRKGVKVEYPDLTTRVALSEAEMDRGLPRALLFREGLLPYAEAVAGSRRMCKAVRRATLLGLLGSLAGTLLAFYLVSMGAYELLTPLALEVFSLLWALPVLLMAEWTGWY